MTRKVSSPTRSRSPHWPALDGWRGFTIWFAISVHAGYFTGGGVLSLDTFFALSGFLITGLLLREWQRHEGIDLLAFWARRARRLLPALFVVLTAVVAYAAFVASPLGLDTLRGDVLSTLGYGANWRFVLSGQSYFSSFTTPSPVLHMWSLAVEEQFYLVWPLIVLGVLWLARRRLSMTGAIVAVGVVAGVGAVASAIEMAALYTPGGDVSRVYYGTDTRAQAMLVGAVLAVVVLLHGPLRSRVAQTALSVGAAIALVVVVAPWFAPDARQIHDVFYGRFGLLAYSLATAVVLWRLTQPSVGWFGRVLESSPLRWVGAISYEMYLWHWPTYLVLTEQRTSLHGGWLLAFRLLVVVGLSWATNVLVSGPIRRGARLRAPRLARSAVVMVAVAVAVGTFAATVGAEPLLTGETGQLADAGPPPTTAARSAPLKVLVVGDSQGATLAQGPGIEGGHHGLAVQPGVVVWNRALLGCPISSRPTFVIDGQAEHNTCGGDGTWQRQWPADVAAFQPDVVVVAAGAWDLYDVQLDDGRVVAPGDDPTWVAGYEEDVEQMFEDLQASGAPVIALVPPCYGDNTLPGAEPAPSERQDASRIRAVKQVWTAAAKATGATMAPLDGVLCPGGRADSAIRPDGAHYDGAGADRIAPAVMATARAALARSGAVAQSSLRTPRNPNQASSDTHPAS
jgi:peptidoglycan/LPS O-acetylase OafA/YrhL/lysophospholipase L1-like esterase